jgi:hypothetical protein
MARHDRPLGTSKNRRERAREVVGFDRQSAERLPTDDVVTEADIQTDAVDNLVALVRELTTEGDTREQ